MIIATPGPWKADGYSIRQAGGNGTRHVAEVAYTGPHHTPPEEYPKSCRLQDEANARLIAAAPDMLEALEVIRTIATCPHHPNAINSIRTIARNEIAKATGKEHL